MQAVYHETGARDTAYGPTGFGPLSEVWTHQAVLASLLPAWHVGSAATARGFQLAQLPRGPSERSGLECLSTVPSEQLSPSGNGCLLCSSLGSGPSCGLVMGSAAVTVPKASFSRYL